tara:strand:+ start:3475 stop:7725 length:4251 start_codon:yes stop_codon:yes gene_type:complete
MAEKIKSDDDLKIITNFDMEQSYLKRKRKPDGEINRRLQEVLMKEYTHFNRKGEVIELELTDNVFDRNEIPDHYFVPIDPREIKYDEYKNSTINKLIKPILNEDPQTLEFNFTVEDLIEWNGIILKMKIENQNEFNALQLDGDTDNLIESIQLLADGVLIEEHKQWGKDIQFISEIDNDFNEIKNNNSNFLEKGISKDTLSALEYGTDLIFNPPNSFTKYNDINRIINGKLNYSSSNISDYEIVIKLHSFGNLFVKNSTKKQLNDLRGSNKIKLLIKINKDAYFVPVFNARIHDLVNTAIDGTRYLNYRKLKQQLKNLKDYRIKKSDPHSSYIKSLYIKDTSVEEYEKEYYDLIEFDKNSNKHVISQKFAIIFGNDYGNDLLNLFITNWKIDILNGKQLDEKLLEIWSYLDKRLHKDTNVVLSFNFGKKEDPATKFFNMTNTPNHFLIVINYDKITSDKPDSIRIMFSKQKQLPEISHLMLRNTDFLNENAGKTKTYEKSSFSTFWSIANLHLLDKTKRIEIMNQKDIIKTKNLDTYKNDKIFFQNIEFYGNEVFLAFETKEREDTIQIKPNDSRNEIMKTVKFLTLMNGKYEDNKITYNITEPWNKAKVFYYFNDKNEFKKLPRKSTLLIGKLEADTIIELETYDIIFEYLSQDQVKIKYKYFKLNRLNKDSFDLPSYNTDFILKFLLFYDTQSTLDLLKKLKDEFVPEYNEKEILINLNSIKENISKVQKDGTGKPTEAHENQKKYLNNIVKLLNWEVLEIKNYLDFSTWLPYKLEVNNKIQLHFESQIHNRIPSNLKNIDNFYSNNILNSNDYNTILNLSNLIKYKDGESETIFTDFNQTIQDSTISIKTKMVWNLLLEIEDLEEDLYPIDNYVINSSKFISDVERRQIKVSYNTLIKSIGYKINEDKKIYNNELDYHFKDKFFNIFFVFFNLIFRSRFGINTADQITNNIGVDSKDIIESISINEKYASETGFFYDQSTKLFYLRDSKNDFYYYKYNTSIDRSLTKVFLQDPKNEDWKNLINIRSEKIKSNEETEIMKENVGYFKSIIDNSYKFTKSVFGGATSMANTFVKMVMSTKDDGPLLVEEFITTFSSIPYLNNVFDILINGSYYYFDKDSKKYEPLVFNIKNFPYDKKVDFFNNKRDTDNFEKLIEATLLNFNSTFKKINSKIKNTEINKNTVKFIENLKTLIDGLVIGFNEEKKSRIKLLCLIPYIEEICIIMETDLNTFYTKNNNDEIKIELTGKIHNVIRRFFLEIMTNENKINYFQKNSIYDEIESMLDPLALEKLEMALTSQIYDIKERPWISQSEYLILNSQKRDNSNLKISNTFIVTDAILEIKSLHMSKIPEPLDNSPRRIVSEIYSGIFDVEKDFMLPFKNPLARVIYIFFEDLELSKYPTYRKSTKISLPLETFAM